MSPILSSGNTGPQQPNHFRPSQYIIHEQVNLPDINSTLVIKSSVNNKDRVVVQIFSGNPPAVESNRSMCELEFACGDGACLLTHRFVHPEMRRQGLGMRALEIAEDYLVRERHIGSIKIEAGQPSVFRWLTNSGFVPENANDQEILRRCNSFARGENSDFVIANVAQLGSHEEYIFHASTPANLRNFDTSVRINFVKNISLKEGALQKVTHNVRAQLKKQRG